MTRADAFQRWVANRRSSGIEVVCGLHSGRVLAGGLDDPDVRPDEPIRAGGYGEHRSLYTQSLFAPAGEEPRTVHLGLDIFAPEGAEVFAPIDARVHSFQDNAQPGDYGPTIILEHMPESGAKSGVAFYTLYGHLSRASLSGLKAGKIFTAGEQIAWLGARSENGGWTPHLHFQIILEIGDRRGDYPGVCKRSERDAWLAICPDPRPLLGLA
jgi:murein DD-endopeptidase MepM/ murein hydrolase activator NlpD